jgi:hypothetical protein
VSPHSDVHLEVCDGPCADSADKWLAVHSFVQSEANTQRNKEVLLSWDGFLIACSCPYATRSLVRMCISKELFQKDVSSINTIIIYYCSSREGHCTNNKKKASSVYSAVPMTIGQ